MSYTKEEIQEKLKTDLRWTERGLVVLHNRQTEDEQKSKDTYDRNGRGFNSVDGKSLSYCAEWVKKGNHLSGKHLEKVRRKLPKYWKQILELIEQNENKGV